MQALRPRQIERERGKVECRTVRRIDIAAVDQDVAVADQLRQAQRGAFVTRIERDARLVEVEEREPGALPFRCIRCGVAKRIALGRLDLLNARTEVSKQARAIARRRRTSDLDNL